MHIQTTKKKKKKKKVKEKKEELDRSSAVLIKQINKIIPNNEDKKSLEAQIFIGKKGLRILLEEML